MGHGRVASLGSRQGGTGRGGRQRPSPPVVAAYGIPWKSRYRSVTVPRTGPAFVCTMSVDASISTSWPPPTAPTTRATPGAAGRLERQHAADQRPPGDRADDAVDRDRRDVLVQGVLEAPHGGVGLGAEDPVDSQARSRVAGQVAELELLLDPAHGVALAALLDRDDQGRPGVGAEDAVDGDGVAAGPEQVLEGLEGMVLVALADQREGKDAGGGGHLLLLGGGGTIGSRLVPAAARPLCRRSQSGGDVRHHAAPPSPNGRNEMPESPVRELRLALTVDRYEEAVAFYRDLLGLPELESFEGPGGGGVVLDAGRATVELLSVGQAELVDQVEVGARVAGPVRVALEVADSADLARRLTAGGAEALADPVVTPWNHRNARLRAPDGLQLTLFTVLDDDGR